MEKETFLTLKQAQEISKTYPTPFHIYDEKAIRENARKVKAAFAWNPGYKEYFAVKATPNPRLVQILHEEGFGCDCSSYTELQLSRACGITGHDIMFSSNVTPNEDFKLASDLDAIVNFDDITHLDYYDKVGEWKETMSCRFNPGGDFVLEKRDHGHAAGSQVRHDSRAADRGVQVYEAEGRQALRHPCVPGLQHGCKRILSGTRPHPVQAGRRGSEGDRRAYRVHQSVGRRRHPLQAVAGAERHHGDRRGRTPRL